MNRTPFEKALLSELAVKQTSDERIVLTHGTSASNLIYSLFEEGKPATSLALGKTINPEGSHRPELGAAYDESLKKFGDIVFTFDPQSIFDNDLSIYTRDAYSRDAPEKVAVKLSSVAMGSLKSQMETYSAMADEDVIRRLGLEFKSNKDSIKLTDVCEMLSSSVAFRMLYLEQIGVDIELPYVPSIETSELGESLGKAVGVIEYTGVLSDDEKTALLAAHDAFYQNEFDTADSKFIQNMTRKRLEEDNGKKLERAVDELGMWIEATENPTFIVDKHKLKILVDNLMNEQERGLFECEVLDSATLLGSDYCYSCDDEMHISKEDSWEHMIEHSGMQSQQSLVYSQNEIFSLMAEELKPEQVFDKLNMIDPMMFSATSDSADGDHESHNAMVSKFGVLYAKLTKQLGFERGDASAFTKRNLMDSILDMSSSITLSDVKDIWHKMPLDQDETITGTLEELNEVAGSLLPDERAIIDFHNAYHHIRSLKSDLDHALDMPSLSYEDSRDFYKEALPMLHDDFSFESVMGVREEYVYSEGLRDDEEHITVIVDALRESFRSLPEEVPYFELVTNYTLELDSPKIKSIHAPDDLKPLIEHLSSEHPFLADKVEFYNPDVAGALSQSIVNSGVAVLQNALSPESKRTLAHKHSI
ncbi:conserved hypothetical protein [Vibrio chagasii]|nr:conserved hypothetical protein [Vibrio chagasii]